MKARDIPFLIVAVFALIFYVLWDNEKEQRKNQEEINRLLHKEITSLKQSYMTLFISFMLERASARPDTIKELEALKGELDELDKAAHVEIDSVIRHVNQGEYSKGLRDLAKVLENKLKEHVQKDKSFGNQRPTLGNMLKHAFSCKWIDEQEYQNGVKLKDIRNEESHENGVEIKPLDAGLMVFAGVKLLFSIALRR